MIQNFFPGPHFTNREAISGANVVPIGEKSWIKVKTVEADPSVRIQLESCSAVTFPNGKAKVPLIKKLYNGLFYLFTLKR